MASWIRNASLVLASTCLALGVAEVATRLLLPEKRGVSWYHLDDRYGMRHRSDADARTTEWGDGAPWRFRTNSRGFRGPEWTAKPGARRVLVLGDSMTFGNAVDAEAAYPAVANSALGSATWEIRNLGTSAWGPQNALAYLDSEGADLEASCMVYGFFLGNDVLDGVVSSLYEIRDDRLRRIPKEPRPPSPSERVRSFLQAVPFYDALLEHSQLFNVLRDRGISYLTRHDATRDNDLYHSSSREEFERALRLNDATMDALRDLARARFGGFGVVLIPMREQLAPSLAGSETAFPIWIADRSRDRMRSWCVANGVPFLDLGDELPHAPAQVAPLYFQRDFHFSVEGNREVGTILARRIPSLCGAATPGK